MADPTLSFYIPKLFSVTPKEGYFTLEFDEGKSHLYISKKTVEKVESLQIAIGRTDGLSVPHKFSFSSDTPPDLFTALYGVAFENKHLNKLLTPARRQDPRIFEILRNCLSILYPSESLEFSKKLINHLSEMDLKDAYAIANASTDEISFATVLARRRITSAIYFATEQEANSCIDQKEQKLISHSPQGLLCASKYANADSPLIRRKAKKAQQKLQLYREKLTPVLKSAGIDTSNTKIMEHLVGPKSFLFSHYGIVLSANPDDSRNPFCWVPVLQNTCSTEQGLHLSKSSGFGFSFKPNAAPRDIENEMRKKILLAIDLKEDFQEPIFYDFSQELYCCFSFPKRLFSLNPGKEAIQQSENKNNFSKVSSLKFAEEADAEDVKKQKKAIYFPSSEKAQEWFADHPSPEEFKKYKATPWALQHALHHCDIDKEAHPEVLLAALKAEQILNTYKKVIISELKDSDASMNPDLLKHIVGPEDYLFSRYGIVPEGELGYGRYRFHYIPGAKESCAYKTESHIPHYTPLGYTLENPTHQDLEEEIRRDIAAFKNS